MTTALEKTLTVREFLELDIFEEGYLYELINGEIVKRASPDTDHQRASIKLLTIFLPFVTSSKLGEVFHAPYDVYLDEINLEQPDLIFVSQAKSDIVRKGCIEGVPDLVVEILSPGTYKIDRGDKFKVYQRLGVSEYWIIDPRGRTIEVHTLNEGFYELTWLGEEGGEVESKVLAGLKVKVDEVFV